MRKENFNIAKYEEGKHDVVTRLDKPVTIAAIDATMKSSASIIGWVDKEAFSWTLDGKFIEGETDKLDLFLKEKSRKVFVNITRTVDGEIRVYGTVDIKPRGPYKGAELIKTLEIDV